jgi:hypothetical protein
MKEQERSLAKHEQQVARAERQDLRAELAEQAAQRPRRPRNRRRTVTLSAFAGLFVLAALVGWLTMLPAPGGTPGGGVPVGTAAPTFVLPIAGGGVHGMIDLHALRGHPVLINFWSESCPACRAEMPYLERMGHSACWASTRPIRGRISPPLVRPS